MKVKDIMTTDVVKICPQETADVAARTLEHYNIGALPVCGLDGSLRGVLTDRDLVVRCLASGKLNGTLVGDLMTKQVITVTPETEVAEAAAIMGRNQIRRLPVVKDRTVCGMLSLGDISARGDSAEKAAGALSAISSGLSQR